jgi:hypothetical protein
MVDRFHSIFIKLKSSLRKKESFCEPGDGNRYILKYIPRAHCDLSEACSSSLKHSIETKVPVRSCNAQTCSLLSEISSS